MRKFVVETLNKRLIVDDIDGVIQAIQDIKNDRLWHIVYGEEDNPCLYLDEALFVVGGYADIHRNELMQELNDALNI